MTHATPDERFFYHSFPRRSDQATAQNAGLKILESICRNGLLLVPERISWSDPTQRDPRNRTHAIQRRICFTELASDEVPEHSRHFGPFALEFTPEKLRSLGAIPVIYIPDSADTGMRTSLTGTSMLAHFAAASSVVSAFAQTLSLTGPTLELELTMKDGKQVVREFSLTETVAIRTYLSLILQAQGIHFQEMHGALSAMCSLFYPTDHPRYTGPLGYYRQREWRIVSGSYIGGNPTTTVATPQQANDLLGLDHKFFSRRIKFADGEHSLASKSHFLSRLGDQHILSYAHRLIVPPSCMDEAVAILGQFRITLPVTSSTP